MKHIISRFFGNLLNIGINPEDDHFKVRLKQAVNVLTLNSVFCMTIAGIYEGLYLRSADALILLLGVPYHFVIFCLNWKDKVYWALTILFAVSAVLLAYFSIHIGEDSFTHSLFILNIIGLSVLYRDKSVRRFYWGNLIFTLICLAFVLLSFHNTWFSPEIDLSAEYRADRRMNLFFLVFCSIVFSLVLFTTFSRQFKYLSKTADEKQVLLAELNHRVNNNLTIINGLLNLKMENCKTDEAKNALKDVRSRIHSMALVHQHMYDVDNKDKICLKDYIEELIVAISSSFESRENVRFNLNLDLVCIDVVSAIPFGMIMNELLTNAYKYAMADTNDPELSISLAELEDGRVKLIFQDNGPGVDLSTVQASESLGLDLIKSLTEQIDGIGEFTNQNGFRYEMLF